MTLGNMPENGVRSLAITCGAVHCNRMILARQPLSVALPPIADMCSAQAHVRFVPIADIAQLVRSALRPDRETY